MNISFIFFFELIITRENILNFGKNCIMIILISFWQWYDILIDDRLKRNLWNIKKLHKTPSCPVSFLLIMIVNNCVASSDVISEKRILNIELVFIGASCIHTIINNFEVFVSYMVVRYFFYGFGVFLNGFVHLLWISDKVLELSNSSEFLLFFSSFDRISLILVLILLLWLSLHDL